MTRDELLALPAVVPLWPTAGRAWGMGKTATYEAAARGEFPCPVRRLGHRWRVVTEQLLESLGISRSPDMDAARVPPRADVTATDPTESSRENDTNHRTAGHLHSA